MESKEIRKILIDSAISIVAREGFEEASIRSIGEEAGINGASIYRYFVDKKDLLKQAYIRELTEFSKVFERIIKEQESLNNDEKEKIEAIWDNCLMYLLSKPIECKFCRYYYNSPNYTKFVKAECNEIADKMKFRLLRGVCKNWEDTDVEHLIYHVFDQSFGIASRIIDEPDQQQSIKDFAKKILEGTFGA